MIESIETVKKYTVIREAVKHAVSVIDAKCINCECVDYKSGAGENCQHMDEVQVELDKQIIEEQRVEIAKLQAEIARLQSQLEKKPIEITQAKEERGYTVVHTRRLGESVWKKEPRPRLSRAEAEAIHNRGYTPLEEWA